MELGSVHSVWISEDTGRQLILSPQILLDYPLAFGSLGPAGAFRSRPLMGVAVGMAGRYFFHVISGLLFFQQYAWAGWNPIAYVFAYNAILIPEFIVSSIIIAVINQRKLIDIYL